MVERSPSNSGKNKQKIELLHIKVDKKFALLENSLKIFQEDSRVLGVLIRGNFASPWVGTVQKGATN